MKQAVRAIVIRGDKLLVMKRNKFGQEYYTLIGGRVELNETPEQALVRELDEEASMRAQTAQLVFIEKAGEPYGDQLIYLCQGVEGEPVLREDAEEARINALGQNLYQPVWLPLAQLAFVPFKSEVLKRKLIESLKNGFPAETQTFDPSDLHS